VEMAVGSGCDRAAALQTWLLGCVLSDKRSPLIGHPRVKHKTIQPPTTPVSANCGPLTRGMSKRPPAGTSARVDRKTGFEDPRNFSAFKCIV